MKRFERMRRERTKLAAGTFVIGILLFVAFLVLPAFGQTADDAISSSGRIGVSAGMGVNFHVAQDIVDRVNGSGITTERVGDFKSGVEFFGAVTIPFAEDWIAKGEYVYMLASYSLNSVFGTSSEFTYTVHMPGLVVQYILFSGPMYNLKAGVGAGYHLAEYEEKFFGMKYNGRGVGTVLELEGNTALGDDLFAHLGIQSRWEFIGTLKDSQGRTPFGKSAGTTLSFFSIGARLGMTYYF